MKAQAAYSFFRSHQKAIEWAGPVFIVLGCVFDGGIGIAFLLIALSLYVIAIALAVERILARKKN